jgi:hypothetical protein
LNVSHTYSTIDTFHVFLNVTDSSDNEGTTMVAAVVQANSTARPDLDIVEGTFEVSPSSPEEGSQVKLSINITNKEGHASADNVSVTFSIVSSGGDETPITGTVRLYFNGTATDKIAPGQEVRAEITWTPGSIGNFTIKINATADNEYSGTTFDNALTAFVNVGEAGWKKWLIYGLIIGVPVIILLLIWLRRKYQRGELFRRRDEDEEDEKPRKRRKRRKGKEED